ncbi:myelin expression factor 2-like isoform X2 [Branchiostoma floridae]|uniref:Myelin expression factor 2-like isoform X2 n=1 Tax=Branchiostoma floridae TaxID=7739 RepID=A0A9J7HWR9_BRAFL|nr:myelin expression factor 2-like isoform X2 [Branchiostoma floridae]
MSTEEVETPVAENGSSEPKSSSPKPAVKKEKSSGDRDNRSRGGRDRRDRDRDRRYQPYGREGRGGGGGGGRGSRAHGQDPERTVYISNIPYEMKWQDIKDLFRDKVGEVTYVEMFTDMDGKSRGCGIVEFKDKDVAKKAVDNLHKHQINGRNIIVREDSSGELQRRARIKNDQGMPGGDIGGGPMGGMGGGMGNMGGGMGNMGGGMGNMGGGMGNMGGGMGNMGGGMGNMGGGMGNMGGGMGGNSNVDPDLMRRLNNGDISNVVFVANLDYKVTWKKLKDIFKMAGNVLRAEIKTDNEGKSRGHGTVTFEFPLEAAQAISMFNGQKLFDRTMVVRPDSKAPGDMGRDPGPKLPSGLSGIGAGLGPGGQPLNVHQMGSGGGGGGGNMGGGMGSGGMGGGGMGGGMGGGLGGGMGGNMGGGMGNMGGMSDLGGSMDARLSVSTSREDIGRGTGGLGMGDLGGGMGMGGGMGNMGDTMGSMGGGMGSPNMGSGMGGGFGGGMGGGNMGGMGGGMGNPMGGGMGGGGMGGGGGMMGGGMDNNMGRGMGGRNRSCQIFVRNLPWAFTWQMLKEKFKSCGRVMYAEIKTENGKSKGCGTVRFETPEGAQRACDMMNGIKLDGREIDIRIDRSV